jgi:hypothetical protein
MGLKKWCLKVNNLLKITILLFKLVKAGYFNLIVVIVYLYLKK